ncbi:hypothetical protein [Microbulbifer yueqingensis]|uniref:Ribosomal protein L7/L12 C-terminal domain-containing protein n=1 Tax=Microbulbifer yueqingensis TaxID=658219 RepID=A0A1G8XGS4_9GAMM|nr:hypothetical protein [Microbulbifer yueqingensis]SDJ88940.1 hypothetical protein SAMN05216212_1065 [Microbulbifer yueqingensis]
MSEIRYSLIFRGDLVPGYTAEDVKANLARLFKAGPGTVEKLFSGRPLAIKKGLPEAQARQMLAALEKAGAQAALKAEGEAPAAQKPAAAAPRPAPESRPGPRPEAAGGLSVAPMDGNLVKDHERERKSEVQVEVGHLSLKPQQGNLVDESEQKRAPAARVQVPDWQLD